MEAVLSVCVCVHLCACLSGVASFPALVTLRIFSNRRKLLGGIAGLKGIHVEMGNSGLFLYRRRSPFKFGVLYTDSKSF